MLKRQLSLNETWRRCLKMWIEMTEQLWEQGINGSCLKAKYFDKHKRIKIPGSGCYFCDYAVKERIKKYGKNSKVHTTCNFCPGRLVDKSFHCLSSSYNNVNKPKAFCRKLLELDKKRRTGR